MNDSLKVCKQDLCVEANGKYADGLMIALVGALAIGAVIMIARNI